MKSVRLSLPLILGVVCSMAQGTFVYTNNDILGSNSVSALSMNANGSLTPIPGSPFLTGGTGIAAGFSAANRITSVAVKGFLYAANSGSNNVSAFSIDPGTGFLTPVPGSPFATGGVARQSGMSLAPTPDDKFLIAANGFSDTITVYSIGTNGTLAQVAGSPFPGGAGGSPNGIKVTPDGRFLVVGQLNAVSMFSISATGGLTPVPGSPFLSSGAPAGVDCDCKSSHVFAGNANFTSAQVSVFDIALDGALSQIPGSPFTSPGINSNVVVLSPDDKSLFVSNQVSSTVSVFSVAATGALTLVPGSPFDTPGALFPSGMATNQAGSFLYVASTNSSVYGYSVAANGALTAVPGSPFSTGALVSPFSLFSLTVFPPKSCCPAPVISGTSAMPDVLWPPNHKFVEVTIDYTVTDRCPNTCVLTVASNEPVNGTGDGNTSPDWEVIDANHARLRAERAGGGTGRIYTITITCANDSNKESSIQTATVLVPHDQGK
jgi:6-phosphogluconolactonase (cycloisomerase 2 family)